MENMRFLIAGLGSIGRRHLRNLLALGQDDIILYRSGHSTLSNQDLMRFPTAHDLQTALNYHPDAVIVSNPTALHLSVAIPAARQGCHLFLEKPISHNMEGISTLRHIVQQNGVKVLVGFQFRFHPSLLQIKQLLADGVIGRALWARAHWGEYLPNWHPWEDYRQGYSARPELGGGVLLTLCHPLDYMTWLFGKAEKVTAVMGKFSDLDLTVEDTAEIILSYPDPFIASVHLDYLQQPPQHWLEIVGSKGTIHWDYYSGAVMVEIAGQTTGSPQTQTYTLPAEFERNDMFLAEMQHFIEVIQGRNDPICSLEDGIYSLSLVLAAKKSSQTGKQQVVIT